MLTILQTAQQINPVYVVGGLFTVIYGLIELLKVRSVKKNGVNGKFDEKDRRQLNTLFEQHQQRDEDGRPIWYVPKAILGGQAKQEKLQQATLEELQKLNTTMNSFKCPYVGGEG